MKYKIFANIFFGIVFIFIVCFFVSIYSTYKFCAANGVYFTLTSLIGSMLYYIAAAIVITLVLSVFLAVRVSKKVTAPINSINLSNPDERDVYPEIRPLVKRINAQNRQIQKQLEELKAEHEKQDNMRKEFTANISHELKTPLTSISGYAEIMKNGFVKPEDISRFSGIIFDETQRLITLVGDIINLSRLDENKVGLDKEDVDICKICNDVIKRLSSAAKMKNVNFVFSGKSSVIYGAPQIIEEIVYNICDNAIKYNKENGIVKVEITQDSKTCTLSVEDSGIGIPKDEIGRVFERFYRVDKSHSKEIGGTGLGLSIVKHGVAYHGAEIEIESELGTGTKITVIFKKNRDYI